MDATLSVNPLYGHRLDSSQKQIRLLKLRPGDFDDSIDGTLTTVSINDNQRFIALSYTWGDPSEREPIVVNGARVEVTVNLEAALRHLQQQFRRFGIDLPLWIDALCINQSDDAERSSQVRLMADIYGTAFFVIVWLGEGDEYSDWLFDRFDDAAFKQRISELASRARRPNYEEIRAAAIIDRNLDQRHWWSRTWVLQEIVLARDDPILTCGLKSVRWSTLEDVRDKLPANKWQYPELESEFRRASRETPLYPNRAADTAWSGFLLWKEVRDVYQRSGPFPIHDILHITGTSWATDPRDYIYGCLGTVRAADAAKITIDYRRDPMGVFHDAMKLAWTSARGDLLSVTIPSLSFAELSPGYPSWVPDFAAQHSDKLKWTARGLCNLGSSSKPWRAAQDADASVSDDSSTLRFKGVELDSIDTLYLVGHKYGLEIEGVDAIDLQSLRMVEEMVSRGRQEHINADSRLAPLEPLRNLESAQEIFTYWNQKDILPGVDISPDHLWEILLERAEVPEGLSATHELGSSPDKFRSVLLSPLLSALRRRISSRKVFSTRSGFTGVGTPNIQKGDMAVFPFGAKCPYILRPSSSRRGYNLVGFAYVSGLMDPKALNEYYEKGSLEERIFDIF